MVVKMCSSLRVLVFLARVIVEVDALIIIVVWLFVLLYGLSIFILLHIIRTIFLLVHTSISLIGIEIVIIIAVVPRVITNISVNSSLHLKQ